MNYSDALQFILSLPDWERGTGSRTTQEELLLARPAALLRALGEPQTRYRSVLITGTKGKGSTAALMESILRAAGYKTGLYVSPHLHTYRERIRVNGAMISPDEFARGVGELETVMRLLRDAQAGFENFSTFEIVTALALQFFARVQIDIAILEVGLGGRLDATNVVDADLSLVTPISFDHMAVLGDTLPKIAWEKAGILKPRKIALTAPQAPDALAVIERAAHEKNVALGVGERDWLWLGEHGALMVAGAPRAGVWQKYWHVRDVRVPLLGVHQLANAALAIAAAETLAQTVGMKIDAAAMRAGVAATQWPGRLEILQARDATRPWIVTDGAHNGDSMEKLIAALKFHFEFENLYLIFGALRDKALDSMVQPLVVHTTRAWTVETFHPRTRDATFLAQELNAFGLVTTAARDVNDALAQARTHASPRDLICLTGSLSVVALARQAFGLVADADPF